MELLENINYIIILLLIIIIVILVILIMKNKKLKEGFEKENIGEFNLKWNNKYLVPYDNYLKVVNEAPNPPPFKLSSDWKHIILNNKNFLELEEMDFYTNGDKEKLGIYKGAESEQLGTGKIKLKNPLYANSNYCKWPHGLVDINQVDTLYLNKDDVREIVCFKKSYKKIEEIKELDITDINFIDSKFSYNCDFKYTDINK